MINRFNDPVSTNKRMTHGFFGPTKPGTFAGVGFAIPIDTVAKNVGAMIEEGKVWHEIMKTSWGVFVCLFFHLDVSLNGGTPKWMVYNGKPYSNWWFGGTIIFWNTHIIIDKNWIGFLFWVILICFFFNVFSLRCCQVSSKFSSPTKKASKVVPCPSSNQVSL